MNERTYSRFCLVLSLLGIIILYSFMRTSEIDDTFTFFESEDGDEIRIHGRIGNLETREGYSSFDIIPKDTIRVVVFDDVDGLRVGEDVLIEGRISDNEDFPRNIIADRIEKE